MMTVTMRRKTLILALAISLLGLNIRLGFAQTVAFNPATNFPVGGHPVGVAIGDFNRDGKLDLAVANSGDNTISILLGVGNGTFGARMNFAVGLAPESVAVGSFTADKRQDLAVGNVASDNVSILLVHS